MRTAVSHQPSAVRNGLLLLFALAGLLLRVSAQEIGVPTGATRKPVALNQSCAGSDKTVGIGADGNILCAADQTGAGGLPAGAVVLIVSGSCSSNLGAGWSEVGSLDGKFVLGTVAANGDIAASGGSDTVTPAGTVSQPGFTGSPASTSSESGGTPSGTVGAIAATATAAGTKGTSTANVAAQTHTHPAPSCTGAALPGHSHTVTAAGAVSQPAFTGTPFDNRPAFVKVIFCKKD